MSRSHRHRHLNHSKRNSLHLTSASRKGSFSRLAYVRNLIALLLIMSGQVIDVPAPSASSPPTLSYDPEWLAITKAFNPYMSVVHRSIDYPDETAVRQAVEREFEWVQKRVFSTPEGGNTNSTKLVEDVQVFSKTAPGPGEEGSMGKNQRAYFLI